MVKKGVKRRKVRKKLRLGLALGAGGSKGLAHIGILKALCKHKIYPDYITGTSMGAVIGALYAAGHSPEEIESLMKTTNWQTIADFTVPKRGLLRGLQIERIIRKHVFSKSFAQLAVPLRVVAYNLSRSQREVFSHGDVAKAVRASVAIPGVFNPVKIGPSFYIDGAISDPTPFGELRKMGADVIIAVDLFSKEKVRDHSPDKGRDLFAELRNKFILVELLNVRNYLFPKRWPRFVRNILNGLFDKILYPTRILKIMSGRELPEITKIFFRSIYVLSNNLARERLDHGEVDVKVTPSFDDLGWADFDQVEEFSKIGEQAMLRKISVLRKKLGR